MSGLFHEEGERRLWFLVLGDRVIVTRVSGGLMGGGNKCVMCLL